MTSKQYEHLGRAVALEAKLEEMREGADGMCDELARHLATFVGSDAANRFVTEKFGKQLRMFAGARDFMNAVRQILESEEKKEDAE